MMSFMLSHVVYQLSMNVHAMSILLMFLNWPIALVQCSYAAQYIASYICLCEVKLNA